MIKEGLHKHNLSQGESAKTLQALTQKDRRGESFSMVVIIESRQKSAR